MINDVPHARSYARDLKRLLKPYGVAHMAAHDIAARTIGVRDWRTLVAATSLAARRDEVAERLMREMGKIDGLDAKSVVESLLPPTSDPNGTGDNARRWPHPDRRRVDKSPAGIIGAFDGRQLDNVLHAIRMDHRRNGGPSKRRIDECLDQGWFPKPALEDLVHDSDHRLRIESIGMSLTQLMDRLGWAWADGCTRPLASSTSTMMFKAMAAADAAAFLILLERMGFEVPARTVVERLLPDLKKRRILSQNELCVLWYPREVDRCHLRFVAEDVERADRFEDGRTPNGYRYEATVANGAVGSLEIRGSKHRRRMNEW